MPPVLEKIMNVPVPPTRGIPIPHTRSWMDVSAHSIITVCALCNKVQGAYGTGSASRAAHEALDHHKTSHEEVQGFTEAEAIRLMPCDGDIDCIAPRIARGLCRKHYQREYREWKAETSV